MTNQNAIDLRTALKVIFDALPHAPEVIWSSSSAQTPNTPYIEAEIKDGESNWTYGVNTEEHIDKLILTVNTDRSGETVLREISDALDAQIPPLMFGELATDFIIRRLSRVPQTGDFASFLVMTLTFEIKTYTFTDPV